MKYGIVRCSHSSNFMVFPTLKEAQEYASGQQDFYAEEANDPFMTFEKFIKLPEFQGW
ncbi:MAG: hypothetical protein PHT84_06610 [Candidatus Pacebacteria bacterium]|nr:hypothetical protein [Candidatus Paceibacterota bacterium]